jgi:peptidoglycan/xylan/chitin deacetylase (PgdA/CDA1 family)
MNPLTPLQSALLRAAGTVTASLGASSLLVLIYHRVLPARDPLLPDEPDAAGFAAQLDVIGSLFNVLPLAEAVRKLRAGQLPARAVCITFDDGYANNCEVALPILKSRGMPATVFVAPGFLSGGRMFNDTVIEALRRAPAELDLTRDGFGRYELPDAAARVRAITAILPVLKYLPQAERIRRATMIAERVGADLPDDLMMTEEQVRRLHRGGITIGAHTVNHPILANVDDATARREIVESKARLEQMIGAPVTSFAYPNGGPARDYTGRDVVLAREAGFEVAVSTAWGAATAAADPLQLPRIAPWDRTALRFGVRMVRAQLERQPATV